MEYSISVRTSLVHELKAGQFAAEQLRRRLNCSALDDPKALSDLDLAEAILKSFTNSLSIATNNDPSLMKARFQADECKVEGGEESSRIRDRRGCYKRRKKGQSWFVDGEAPAEDSYAWRKYGQKEILNAKFPRSYYRCTHKIDQGCQAIKQVQKLSEDPFKYRTTYNGQHSCKKHSKTTQISIPSSSHDQSDSSILLSFERSSNNNNINSNNTPFFPPSNNNSIKQELPINAQAMMNMMMVMNRSPPSDYNYLSSPSDLDVISVGTYPGSASPSSLDFDMILGEDHHLDYIQYDCDDIL